MAKGSHLYNSQKKALIRELALTPAVHRDLLNQFPDGIKSDATAVHYLVFEGGFNESAAGEVVTEFKATADYAGLYGPDMILDKSDPAADEDDSDAQDERHEDRGGGRTKGLKLMDGERILTGFIAEPSIDLFRCASKTR
jgi:hypothetical protein